MYKLVIADDEIGIRDGLANTINWNSLGIEVVGVAEDGEEAFEIICDTNPDIVLLDIRMPGMDGIELMEVLKKSSIKSKIVIISGYSDFNYAQKAIKLGAFDYILKPINENELLSSISNCVDLINKQKLESKEKDNLKNLLSKSKSLLNNHLLLGFITKNISLSDIKAYNNIFNNSHSKSLYTVAVVNIQNFLNDNFDSNINSCNGDCLNKALNIINEIINVNISCYVLKNEPFEIVLVLSSPKFKEEIFKMNLTEYLISIYKELRYQLNLEVSIGLGRTFYTFEMLPQSYNEAVIAYCFRIITNTIHIYKFEEVMKKFFNDKIDLNIEERILNLVKAEDKEKIDEYIKRLIFAYVVQDTGKRIDGLRLIITSILEHCLRDVGESLIYSTCFNSASNRIIQKLNLSTNIEEIYYLTRNMLFDIINSIKPSSESPRKIIMKALDYISEHYNKNLLMNDVARKFYLTPSYFSKIFSEEVGEPFSKYIIKLRIEKAKELLKDPCLKVYEVSEKVGYEDPRYFMKLFKGYVGITATQYRERVL